MSTRDYNPATAERKWQRVWEERGTFRASRDPSREKFYVLEMFPYPSGRIHVGHVRNYTLGDGPGALQAGERIQRSPSMGWDAFGLPAENAARDRGIHPGRWTRDNIAAMREQLRSMGFSLDWSREFATCDVEYYGAQQALFLDFLEAGCVYRRSAIVNWDPVDQTVLANEQVIDGRGWRSNAVVERREMTQWFFRISDFAEELLAAEERLEGWPDRVRLMQRNWIGRSEGLRLDFALEPSDIAPGWDRIEVFTTRHDTIFGAGFIALSADHPLAREIETRIPGLDAFARACREESRTEETLGQAEKRGFDTGLRVRHPFDPDRRLSVHVANFVLLEYGTGAVFGCAAHDQRDLEFANRYGLPVIPVVIPPEEEPAAFRIADEAYLGPGTLWNSAFLNGMTVEEAKAEIARRAEAAGNRPPGYHLQAPGLGEFRASAIGAARCPWSTARNAVLCRFRSRTFPSRFRTTSSSMLRAIPLTGIRLGNTFPAPSCGRDAKRETDTMDTFVDSSWYFVRFLGTARGAAHGARRRGLLDER